MVGKLLEKQSCERLRVELDLKETCYEIEY
jgi:hypothetical protein